MEQIDLAHKLGRKSASSISEWEKGKYTPKLKTLSEIASIFKVSIDDLMDEDLSNMKEDKKSNTFQIIAAHLEDDLTEEEWQEVIEYAEFIKSKRKK